MEELAAVRVLVVSTDTDGFGMLIATLLETAAPAATDVYVEHAESLTDAARRLTAGPQPHAVVLDLGVPDATGTSSVANVAALSSLPAAPPVVAVSSAPGGDGRDTVAAGASDHLGTEEFVRPGRLWNAVSLAMIRHRRTRELKDQSSELARATTQLGHLSARLKHDLRAPLSIALAALETLEAGAVDQDARDGLLAMVRQRLWDLSGRLDELAGALAVGDVGGPPSREEVELGDLVREVRSDLAPWDRGRLELELVGGEKVWAARRLLRGLLGGLIRNALQHNPDVPVTVRLEVRLEHGRAVIVVADDGVGIAPEVRDAVFDVGWTTLDPPSHGVGLAAASSAVAMMEGAIRAVDSPYGGAAFRIELPQRPARATAPA